jgi:pyruvate kinase
MLKKTKIICTLGPASSDPEVLHQMIKAGMNIVRLNFSHGTYEEHAARIQLVRQAAAKAGATIGIIADIQGPKIRIGSLAEEPMVLTKNEPVTLSINPAKEKTKGFIYIDYPTLTQDVPVGGTILLADGMIRLEVLEAGPEELKCQVVYGGELTAHKGITLPGISVNLPALMEKDYSDIEFAIRHQVDFIAVSFARKAEHILEIRDFVQRLGGSQLLIAKIENEEGLKNSRDIIQVSDGLMVARGDMGVEVPPEDVPLFQKTLIELCNSFGKPVITATEMLESMIKNPRPTRAEVTDIAHAILDGTDAIMLSAETAVGKYPVMAVEMMSRVAKRMEASLKYEEILAEKKVGTSPTIADAICHATCQSALDLKVVAIICSTQTGSTARKVSKYRPQAPIIAATPCDNVARQLTLSWGVSPQVVPMSDNIDSMIDVSVNAAKKTGYIKSQDLIVITAGVRTGMPGSTNLIKAHVVE